MKDKSEEQKEDQKKRMLRENAMLKAKIAYSIGSLETVSYLLKNKDPKILERNLEHLKKTVERVLSDLQQDL